MDINFSKVKILRPQVRLRHLTLSDAQSIWENVKDKAIIRYTVHIPHPYKKSDAVKFIKYSEKAWKEKSAVVFGIELKETKEVIGIVSLSKIDKKNKNCELGYWLGKRYWRKGVMSSIVKTVLNIAFNKLNLHRVYARVFASNTASLRVLEKNKFLLEGILFESSLRHRHWHNIFLYGLLKSDFNKNLDIDRSKNIGNIKL